MNQHLMAFWSLPAAELLVRLKTTPSGLASDEAQQRLHPQFYAILHATPDQFRTGWFMESVISASMIVLVIRTKKPFFRSIPGKVFGFSQLPVSFLLLMGMIVAHLTSSLQK